jgi:hypothetical protein
MLAAEIHGKIGIGRAPHQRLEDVLTSDVFSIFRFIDELGPAAAILRCGENVRGDKLEPGEFAGVEVHFWPRFAREGLAGWREPDCLLLLVSAGGEVTAITVESKYDSGLSNHGPGGEDLDAAEDSRQNNVEGGHQLADEFMGLFEPNWSRLPDASLAEFRRAKRRLLLYVTCHDVIPASDLDEAVEHVRVARDGVDLQPERAMFWLGWSAIYEVLGDASAGVLPPGAQRLVDDVRAVLKLRGMTPFNPFQALSAVETYEPLLEQGIWSQELRSVPKYEPLLR